MATPFSSNFFTGNRRRLRQAVKHDAPIVITANGLLQKGSIDSAYLFYQDADFWYLTGIDEPDIILVIDGDDEYLIVPERPAIREAFDGAVTAGPLKARSGVKAVLDGREGWERLEKLLKKSTQAVTPLAPPAYVDRYGIYANPAKAHLAAELRARNNRLKLLDARPALARLRMIKQPVELQAMQSAIDITTETLKEVFKPAQRSKYSHEYELEADITRGFRRRGASGHSFEPIIAGGKRACTLHNVANDGVLASGELVVVDVGAEVEHYAADITRTISLGTPSKRQRQVHEAVLEVQRFALDLLRPGIAFEDYERQVRQYMGEQLQGLGLIKNNTPRGVQKYYPHGTSHFIGLDVHDAGDHDVPLAPGVVVSCEPGIYIPEEGIGIRIEDDVLITETGNKVLTSKLPRDLA